MELDIFLFYLCVLGVLETYSTAEDCLLERESLGTPVLRGHDLLFLSF